MSIRLLCFLISFPGFLLRVSGVGLSEKTNGICIAVAAWHNESGAGFVAGEPVRFNDALLWRPFSGSTDAVELNFPADPAYGIKIRLVDQNGTEITKTPLGNSFGSKWELLHSYKDTRLEVIFAQGSYNIRDGGFSGEPLPSAKDLFQIDKSGIYTLEIQMQMFRHSGSTEPNVWEKNILRFSPIKIKVEKPPEDKP